MLFLPTGCRWYREPSHLPDQSGRVLEASVRPPDIQTHAYMGYYHAPNAALIERENCCLQS